MPLRLQLIICWRPRQEKEQLIARARTAKTTAQVKFGENAVCDDQCVYPRSMSRRYFISLLLQTESTGTQPKQIDYGKTQLNPVFKRRWKQPTDLQLSAAAANRTGVLGQCWPRTFEMQVNEMLSDVTSVGSTGAFDRMKEKAKLSVCHGLLILLNLQLLR